MLPEFHVAEAGCLYLSVPHEEEAVYPYLPESGVAVAVCLYPLGSGVVVAVCLYLLGSGVAVEPCRHLDEAEVGCRHLGVVVEAYHRLNYHQTAP